MTICCYEKIYRIYMEKNKLQQLQLFLYIIAKHKINFKYKFSILNFNSVLGTENFSINSFWGNCSQMHLHSHS